MKLIVAIAAIFAASPVFAQTAPTPASPAPTDAQAAAPDALRASCREEAKAKDLDGMTKRQAISECVVAKRPDLAGREQCRSDGFAKGLRKEELHAFVKACAKDRG